MAPPRKETKLTPEEIGAVALVSYGHITASEAAYLLDCHRSAITRLLKRLDIDATVAKRRYLDKLRLRIAGIGRRPLTKHQLRERGERALASYETQKP